MRIITDSAADFTQEELAAWDVRCVSTQVILQDGCCVPSLELSAEELWRRLQSGEVVKTSQPSPAAFQEAFEEARAAGEEAVCVCVSSGVSGTLQSARLAAEAKEGFHVVDSLSGTAGQKLLVMHACRLRDTGKLSAAQVAAELEKLRSRVRLLAGIDTLECLARSGRIPKALASLGTLTKLKPVLEVSREGSIGMAGTAFGRHRAIDSLARRIAAYRMDPAYPVIPLYSFRQDNCQALLRKLEALGVQATAPSCAIGPSIAPHIGPEAYGLVFVEAE